MIKQVSSKSTGYLNFVKYKDDKKKTFDIDIVNVDIILGVIKWRSGWRRYVFEPSDNTVFDSSCLKDITEYIDELMEERKNEKNIS